MRWWFALVTLLAGPRHDIHLSHTRMVVEGSTVTCRIRVFHDDTEAALRKFTGRPGLQITAEATQDTVFERYVASVLTLTSDGARLQPRVVQSGPDPEAMADARMWWFVVEYRAPRAVTALGVRHALMFDQFANQRNVVTVLKMPGETRQSLYFAAPDGREQLVKF